MVSATASEDAQALTTNLCGTREEMHWYVMSSDNPEMEAKNIEIQGDNYAYPAKQYKFRKTFHVSPFMDMRHQYTWTLTSPADKLCIYVSFDHPDDPSAYL